MKVQDLQHFLLSHTTSSANEAALEPPWQGDSNEHPQHVFFGNCRKISLSSNIHLFLHTRQNFPRFSTILDIFASDVTVVRCGLEIPSLGITVRHHSPSDAERLSRVTELLPE